MAECSEMEGTLASVSSDQELDYLLDMAEVGVKIQIGAWLQRSQWLDKSYWDFSKYFPESAEEMGEVVGLSRCVVAMGPDARWKKVSCTEDYHFMCQTYSKYKYQGFKIKSMNFHS